MEAVAHSAARTTSEQPDSGAAQRSRWHALKNIISRNKKSRMKRDFLIYILMTA